MVMCHESVRISSFRSVKAVNAVTKDDPDLEFSTNKSMPCAIIN